MSDRQMQRGKQWLENLLILTGFATGVKSAPPELALEKNDYNEESRSYWLTIDESKLKPEQIDILIGPSGATLDAIQYLANSILNINQEPPDQGAYTIELNGYRLQREAEIRDLAENAAKVVRETGNEYEIKSLSAAERRQLHTFLQDRSDVETFSRGEEPDRRLVVRLR